jgi:predicted DNA-binding transcriptional regulator YafY
VAKVINFIQKKAGQHSKKLPGGNKESTMANHRIEVSRIFKIHTEIASGRKPSISKLADMCDVGERTIKRDIKMMREEMFAPLKTSRTKGDEGYYYEKAYNLAPETFDDKEVAALGIAMQVSEMFRTTPYSQAIKGALDKMREMQASSNGKFDNISKNVSLLKNNELIDRADDSIYFTDILTAIEKHQTVRIKYHSFVNDETSERKVNPYHIYHFDGIWYFFGYCHKREEIRDFAFSRIKEVRLLQEFFEEPDQQEISKQIDAKFGNISGAEITVKIRFDKKTANYIRERIWQKTQQITNFPNGDCELLMAVNSLEAITRWVLSFGGKATVISPDKLIKSVKKELKAMENKYK